MCPIELKTQNIEAICLKTHSYSEADTIAHIYSSEYGKSSVIVKGAKKTKSKLAGACQLFSVNLLHVSLGQSLYRLIQYQPVDHFLNIHNHLLKLAYALLYIELVYILQQDVDSEKIYTLLRGSLKVLNQCRESDLEITTHGLQFQLALLQVSGTKPDFSQCILTHQPFDQFYPYYCFSPQLGGITTAEQKKQFQKKNNKPDAEHSKASPWIQWVYVSNKTCALFLPQSKEVQETNHTLDAKAILKAQRFLQFYYQTVVEKPIQAYDLILSLLE
ncbi:MAG: DNA repair protein RecO [Cyanobacteria bacterium P01_H01_bin.74]